MNFFGDIPGMFVHLFQIILNFLYICQSVSWLTSLLKLDKYGDISSSEWDLSEIFWRHSRDIGTLALNNSEFFVSLLVALLPYWNYTNIETPVLDDISFWNWLETFLGLWYTRSKYFWFSCMSVSLLVGLLPY